MFWAQQFDFIPIINSKEVLPCKAATYPPCPTGIKREAGCTQLEKESQRIYQWKLEWLDCSFQRPWSTSFLPYSLLLWILGSSDHLSSILLLPRVSVLWVQRRACHPPCADLRHVLLVFPLLQTHYGNIFRSSVQPCYLTTLQCFSQLSLLLVIRILHSLLCESPTLHPC